MKFKNVKIGDIFEFPETSTGITKAFCLEHPGPIPVYGSSKNEHTVLGKIAEDLPKIKYYEDCLSWNRNGSVGYVFVRDSKFATNEDHRALLIRDEYKNHLDKYYLKFEIERRLFENGFSFLDKCGVDKIKKVEICIPESVDGSFSLSDQTILSAKYGKITALRERILSDIDNLINIKVNIDVKYRLKNVRLNNGNFFRVERGGRIRKEDINKARGSIPIYSGSGKEDGVLGYVSDDVVNFAPEAKKFHGKMLTVNANGSVGKVFLRTGEFYLHDDVNSIRVLNEKITYEYLLYELQRKIDLLGYDWSKKLYKKEMESSINVEIPVGLDGEFSISAQKEIADKYNKVEQVKKRLQTERNKLMKVELLLEGQKSC